MKRYSVVFHPKALKEFDRLEDIVKRRVAPKIDSLAENPHPDDSVKLSGYKDYFRIKVGDYRIVYRIQYDRLIVLIIRIGARRDVYRNL
jgi:mRNA interferase RelE/StbE